MSGTESDAASRAGEGRLSLSSIASAIAATTILGRAPDRLGAWAVYFPLTGLGIGALAFGVDAVSRPWGGVAVGSIAALAAIHGVSGGRPILGLARVLAALVPDYARPALLRAHQASSPVVYGAALAIAIVELFCLVQLDRFRSVGLLFAPMLARTAMVVLAVGSRAARLDGRRVKFAPEVTFNEFALASTMAFAIVFVTAEFLGLLLILLTGALAVALRVLFHRGLGGVDRAVLNAGCEAIQLAAFALLAAF